MSLAWFLLGEESWLDDLNWVVVVLGEAGWGLDLGEVGWWEDFVVEEGRVVVFMMGDNGDFWSD